MRMSDYVTVIRRRWWIPLLVAIVAAVSGYVFTRFQERLYRSEATYAVVANRIDPALSAALQSNMNFYRELALAPSQLDKISSELQLDRSAQWLLDRHVAIQPQPDQRKMIVQVTYPDPDVAPRLANAIGDNMIGLVATLPNDGSDKISITPLQPAELVWLYWPQTKIIVAAGFVLGLILGLLLAFVLEALDDSIKTIADVERYVQLTTLGAIPSVETHSPERRARGPIAPGARSTTPNS